MSDRLVTYARCDPDGTVITVGFFPANNGWWTPSVRGERPDGTGFGVLLEPVLCSSPYYHPERWIERVR